MNVASRLGPLRVMIVTMAAHLAGCGDADRPEAADGFPTSYILRGGAGAAPSAVGDAGADARWPVCEPGTFSECRIYYRDAYGTMHCPADWALCRPDGKGFYECGEYVMSENGPAKRDAGAAR